MTEEWRPIAGWEDLYEVSDLGRVYSNDSSREIGGWLVGGYPRVNLVREGQVSQRNIHRLVAEAFIPNPDRHPVVRHLNDVRNDNRVENLAWGTQKDNIQDSLRNGKNSWVKKTHCPQGHNYSGPSGYVNPKTGHRTCRVCSKVNKEKNQYRGLSPDDERHGTQTGYNYWRCKCEKCMTFKNHRQRAYREKRKRENAYNNL